MPVCTDGRARGPALVQTVDFFTPIVDDPFTYGQIAAANSLSDVYAMGGTPVTALAIAGFPDKVLDAETIKQIFLGGYDKLREAGVALLGGHTVRDPEVKFGYAVTGAVDPDRIWANAGARAGDRLILTKWLGTGIVGTAIKKGTARRGSRRLCRRVDDDAEQGGCRCAAIVCRRGARRHRRHGFGLIGHATEMARASGVSIAIDSARLPLLPGVTAIASQNRSGGMGTNREHFENGVEVGDVAPGDVVDVCYDPQTSGGLLVAVDAAHVDAILAELVAFGVPAAAVGDVVDKADHAVQLR